MCFTRSLAVIDGCIIGLKSAVSAPVGAEECLKQPTLAPLIFLQVMYRSLGHVTSVMIM